MLMASASQAMLSAASPCCLPVTNGHRQSMRFQRIATNSFRIRASSDDPDCNVEECAPDKEVGKVSMEWLVGEKTKVAGTYPPLKKGWTGYIEKDTAGQTNIYSVEPVVYVAENAISSGTPGSSYEDSQNTAAIVAGLGLISVAAASSILLQVGKSSPQLQAIEYSGPSLSYYINKFKPPELIQASVPASSESPLTSVPESSAPQVLADVESGNQQEPSALSVNTAS